MFKYTLDNKREEIKDVRIHGEDPFRLAVDQPIVTFNKDYVIVKDTHDEYKYGVYDIKNSEVVLNTKYNGLYTTNNGDYIAIKGEKAGLVKAFEIDKNMVNILSKTFAEKENFQITNIDFLKVDIEELITSTSVFPLTLA